MITKIMKITVFSRYYQSRLRWMLGSRYQQKQFWDPFVWADHTCLCCWTLYGVNVNVLVIYACTLIYVRVLVHQSRRPDDTEDQGPKRFGPVWSSPKWSVRSTTLFITIILCCICLYFFMGVDKYSTKNCISHWHHPVAYYGHLCSLFNPSQ